MGGSLLCLRVTKLIEGRQQPLNVWLLQFHLEGLSLTGSMLASHVHHQARHQHQLLLVLEALNLNKLLEEVTNGPKLTLDAALHLGDGAIPCSHQECAILLEDLLA